MNSDDQKSAVELGHEPIAMSANNIVKAGVVLFAVLFGSLLLMVGLTYILAAIDGGMPTVDAPAESTLQPPGAPVLDADQRASLRELREREREVLTEYAWVDPATGVARIPIKRAMEIMADKPGGAPAASGR